MGCQAQTARTSQWPTDWILHQLWSVLIARRGWLHNRCWLSDWDLPLKKSSPRAYRWAILKSAWNCTPGVKNHSWQQSPLWLSRWILFALMGASICWVAYEAYTQFTLFNLSTMKKQCLISCPFLRDEHRTSNVQRWTSNNEVTPLSKLIKSPISSKILFFMILTEYSHSYSYLP